MTIHTEPPALDSPFRVPSRLDTNPLPDCDNDQFDHGMAIGVAAFRNQEKSAKGAS